MRLYGKMRLLAELEMAFPLCGRGYFFDRRRAQANIPAASIIARRLAINMKCQADKSAIAMLASVAHLDRNNGLIVIGDAWLAGDYVLGISRLAALLLWQSLFR